VRLLFAGQVKGKKEAQACAIEICNSYEQKSLREHDIRSHYNNRTAPQHFCFAGQEAGDATLNWTFEAVVDHMGASARLLARIQGNPSRA
jgi:dolichyl-phosphate-mannose--protein O-mannosyl transferase